MKKEDQALEWYKKGKTPSVSTFIDEDTIIMGYGKLDYDFEYPLPPKIITEIYETTSWAQYFENKGLFKWKSTNKETGEISNLGYYTEEQIKEHLELPGNENYLIEKL